LIVAQARGGSATHHPERSLLPIFWFLALVAVGLLSKLAQEPARAWRLPLLALPLAFAASLLLRPAIRETFADRREEELLGGLLRSLGAAQVALDTDDFGYFAVQAALGHGRSFPLSDLDPRKGAAVRAASTEELAERLRRDQARWLLTTPARQPLSAPLGVTRAATTRLVLLELKLKRSSSPSRPPRD
jgi:hypothetical protein